jgi:hypothetical protein
MNYKPEDFLRKHRFFTLIFSLLFLYIFLLTPLFIATPAQAILGLDTILGEETEKSKVIKDRKEADSDEDEEDSEKDNKSNEVSFEDKTEELEDNDIIEIEKTLITKNGTKTTINEIKEGEDDGFI